MANLLRSSGRGRRHGVFVQPEDRRALERDGWRTTLEYQENHVRSSGGRLIEVEPMWRAEAERFEHGVAHARATASSPDDAWRALRRVIADDEYESSARFQLRPAP